MLHKNTNYIFGIIVGSDSGEESVISIFPIDEILLNSRFSGFYFSDLRGSGFPGNSVRRFAGAVSRSDITHLIQSFFDYFYGVFVQTLYIFFLCFRSQLK